MNINGIDYHYYNKTRVMFFAKYDWENLILTVGVEGELRFAPSRYLVFGKKS